MTKWIIMIAGQAVVYGLMALVLGVFSNRPIYNHFPEDKAMVRLSFKHGAKRREKCRRRTAAELAKLPHQKRRPYACNRQRVSLRIEFEIDGKMRYQRTIAPGGLTGDTAARVYQKFVVSPGRHTFVARLRDSARKTGFDYTKTKTIVIKPRQNFVVDFVAEKGGFLFK